MRGPDFRKDFEGVGVVFAVDVADIGAFVAARVLDPEVVAHFEDGRTLMRRCWLFGRRYADCSGSGVVFWRDVSFCGKSYLGKAKC